MRNIFRPSVESSGKQSKTQGETSTFDCDKLYRSQQLVGLFTCQEQLASGVGSKSGGADLPDWDSDTGSARGLRLTPLGGPTPAEGTAGGRGGVLGPSHGL